MNKNLLLSTYDGTIRLGIVLTIMIGALSPNDRLCAQSSNEHGTSVMRAIHSVQPALKGRTERQDESVLYKPRDRSAYFSFKVILLICLTVTTAGVVGVVLLAKPESREIDENWSPKNTMSSSVDSPPERSKKRRRRSNSKYPGPPWNSVFPVQPVFNIPQVATHYVQPSICVLPTMMPQSLYGSAPCVLPTQAPMLLSQPPANTTSVPAEKATKARIQRSRKRVLRENAEAEGLSSRKARLKTRQLPSRTSIKSRHEPSQERVRSTEKRSYNSILNGALPIANFASEMNSSTPCDAIESENAKSETLVKEQAPAAISSMFQRIVEDNVALRKSIQQKALR